MNGPRWAMSVGMLGTGLICIVTSICGMLILDLSGK